MGLLDKIPTVAEPASKPSLGDLVGEPGVRPSPWQVASKPPTHPTLGRARSPVSGGEELQRILALPRRAPVVLSGPRGRALVELMTERLTNGVPAGRGCRCKEWNRDCIVELKPAQAWALYEAPLAGGLLAPIGVGHGKTGLDILMPLVMPGCKLAVLLIPPGLRAQLLRDYQAWGQHFRVPSMIIGAQGYIVPGAPITHVVPFSQFMREESTVLLERLHPDLIIIDEAHKARHPATATTGRILRYFAKHAADPSPPKLCAWSGTLTSNSVKDYAHLSAIALGEGSPLPIDPEAVDEWSGAIDASEWPAPPGDLEALCNPGEHIHKGFHRRLVDTRGVVHTTESAANVQNHLREREAPTIPEHLQTMLDAMRAPEEEGGWVRPDGEELVDILQVKACARQLACGFYYRWIFPHGEPVELIDEWFAARKAWNRSLRSRLLTRTDHLDSPLLCAKAAIRAWADDPDPDTNLGETWHHGSVVDEVRHEPHVCGHDCEPDCELEGVADVEPARVLVLPRWKSEAWPRWRDMRARVYHETEAVWVDDFLAQDAAAWALEHRGIVWYEHRAFGLRVAQIANLPLHEGGPDAEARILAEKGDRSIIASIAAHGTGRDGLQRLFKEQLVANPCSSGQAWEQLLGRLDRIGQESNLVDTECYRHTEEMKEAIDRAIIQARYIEGTMGTYQKLLTAEVHFKVKATRK